MFFYTQPWAVGIFTSSMLKLLMSIYVTYILMAVHRAGVPVMLVVSIVQRLCPNNVEQIQ